MNRRSSTDFSLLTPQVDFIEMCDHYDFNNDLTCKFTVNNYSYQKGDRVALFVLGWHDAKDFVVFEWAENDTNTVVFSAKVLPKKSEVYYQFCYISGERLVRGASTPFEFYATPDVIPSIVKMESGLGHSFTNVNDLTKGNPSFKIDAAPLTFTSQACSTKDRRIIELEAQVSCLKDLLRCSAEEKPPCECKKDVVDLKECIMVLTNHVQRQMKSIEDLQRKNIELVASIDQLNVGNRSSDALKNLRGKLDVTNDLSVLSGWNSIPELPQLGKFH